MATNKELKLRVDDLAALRQRLERMGAHAGETLHVHCLYFLQPPGQVLKLSTDQHGSTLTHLQAIDGGFVVTSNEQVDDPGPMASRLDAAHGRKSTLLKDETLFTLPSHDFQVLLVQIPQVGDFAVVLHPDPQLSMGSDVLGLANPEVITVPFDEIPARA